MNPAKLSFAIGLLLPVAVLSAWSSGSATAPSVTAGIRQSLDQFGYKDVSIKQDRVRGIVTLAGRVSADADKDQAESIARSMAAGEIVSDEIVIIAQNAEANSNGVRSDFDKDIETSVDAALIQNKIRKNVKYHVKGGVVTLEGNVNSKIRRVQVEQIAYAVPNVKQVVNNLQIKSEVNGTSN